MTYPSTGPNYTAGPQNSSKATVALVLGILSWFLCPLIFSIIAIVVGGQAKSEISRSGGALTGSGQATWGVILGWISLVLWIIGAIIYAVVR